MSVIIYNGIAMTAVHTHIERQDIYDSSGQDRLYTKWTIDAVCTYNPRGISYAPGLAAPQFQFGQSPVTTDNAIRDKLSEERKRLLFLVEDAQGNFNIVVDPGQPAVRGRIELECPFNSFSNPTAAREMDARGGPYPKVHEIKNIWGSRTFRVHWQVECYVNECTTVPPMNVILSHRWRMRDDVDEDQFSVRVIEGEAVFNAAELRRRGARPDQYRQNLIHPVPTNFKRKHISVTAGSDDVTVTYTVVDQEMAFNLGLDSPATRVEAYQTDFRAIPSFAEGGVKIAAGVIGGIFNAFGAENKGAAFGALGIKTLESLGPLIPHFYRSIFVRCWGRRAGNRFDLTKLAVGIALARRIDLGAGGGGGVNIAVPFSTEEQLTQDLTGQFVEYQIIFRIAPGLGGAAVALFGGGSFLRNAAEMSEIIETDGRIAINTLDGVNPLPERSRGTRGSAAQLAMAQMLGEACELPEEPTNSGTTDRDFHDANDANPDDLP